MSVGGSGTDLPWRQMRCFLRNFGNNTAKVFTKHLGAVTRTIFTIPNLIYMNYVCMSETTKYWLSPGRPSQSTLIGYLALNSRPSGQTISWGTPSSHWIYVSHRVGLGNRPFFSGHDRLPRPSWLNTVNTNILSCIFTGCRLLISFRKKYFDKQRLLQCWNLKTVRPCPDVSILLQRNSVT